jgi:hypothetical protein
MDTVSNAMGKRSSIGPQELIAQLLASRPQRTPYEEVLARFPTNEELGQGELEAYMRSINGPQGIPRVRINDAGWDAFLESAPESQNIEDRRPDIDSFIRSALAR